MVELTRFMQLAAILLAGVGTVAAEDPFPEGYETPATPPTIDNPPFQPSKSATNAVLVFRRDDGGQGTGFIVRRNIGGKDRFFVYTNQHVIAGVKTPPRAYRSNGTEVKLGKLITAIDYDLAIFTIPGPEASFLEIQENVDQVVNANDPVATPGNAGGGETITYTYGRVLALGPELVEIDAPFKGGNSGGPIIGKNGKVIGIVAFLKEETKDDPRLAHSGQTIVRRFGYRVDNVKAWETPDWKTFVTQGEEIAKVSKKSKDLAKLVNSGFTDWNGNEEIGEAMRLIETKLDNARNQNRGVARAYGDLSGIVMSDLDMASRDKRLYWWWRHNLKQEREFRENLSEHFEERAKQAKQRR